MTRDRETLLPIFPLENVVLFPTVSVPLFIFEPRYREMTQNALNGNRKIGMVAVVPNAELNMGGEPDVFDVGCEGVWLKPSRVELNCGAAYPAQELNGVGPNLDRF